MFVIERQKLFVGLDLDNEFSQITYYDEALFEPCSISQKEGEEAYLIPTVLAVTKENGQWYFGEDAVRLAKEQKAPLLMDFIESIKKESPIWYYEKEWEPVEILKRFLRKCLNLLMVRFPEGTIQMLAVTLENKEKVLVNMLLEALQQLGFEKERVAVLSHQESYLYYTLRQKKELWLNDVGLFDFSSKGLFFYRIFMNRRTSPVTVGIEKKEFTKLLSYGMLESKEEGELAYMFDSVTKNALHKKIVSTIYVTGQGFRGNWCQSVLEGLCVGRRVFLGQNLYAIGACYGAKEVGGESKLSNYLLLNDEMVLVDISVKVFSSSRFEPYHLVRAGAAWFDVNHKLEVIPDEENELELEIFDVMTQQKKTFFLHIDFIEGRPRRTTILEIGVKFLDPKTCVLQVKDKGFGNMYPSTNRIWEKEIHL
ncbi:DUF5716 family protein [[Clostridium] polysaccharolyticum]|uniref:DUF5716 domain-containing protein n=1 Tax=[Clostridium] polysaccharolyticum TaxID=29364 RepID=A0A1H9Y6I1_9FIRM|nr:DUF5716 family protein [[Clostridium] polysaccharolyticum]SES64428.1 hypothetical protein SAMN04487772_101170 [[Clostridium] polysaccharolyticum]